MIGKALKSIFGGRRDEPRAIAPAAPDGPFGLGVGFAANLSLTRLKAVRSHLAMPVAPETFLVSGHGVADLGDGSTVQRLYNDEHAMLQVVCEGGVGPEDVREVMLFQCWDSITPQTDREWGAWDGPGGKIGAAAFEADGFAFRRHWGDPSDTWIEPVQFTEEVRDEDGVRRIHQKVMSYVRQIPGTDDNETLLIIAERDLATGDRGSVSFMIGYDISPADVSAV